MGARKTFIKEGGGALNNEQMRVALAKEMGADKLCHIWSRKWNAYYRPESRGYTGDTRDAGLYTAEQAQAECLGIDYLEKRPVATADPTKDANAAILVVEHMRGRGWNATFENGLDGSWEALFHRPADSETPQEHRGIIQGDDREIYYGAADTLPFAICKSALRALDFYVE